MWYSEVFQNDTISMSFWKVASVYNLGYNTAVFLYDLSVAGSKTYTVMSSLYALSYAIPTLMM